jgi:predicted NUDIX family phosphoesterase
VYLRITALIAKTIALDTHRPTAFLAVGNVIAQKDRSAQHGSAPGLSAFSNTFMQHPKEQILVIPTTLAQALCPAKFGPPSPILENVIMDNHSFREREEAETNLAFKQVIPYILVRYKDQYVMTQRTSQQQETRLHNLYSIGQGGHVNDQDFKGKDPILEGLMRELREEFVLAPEYGCTLVGLINDDSNDVGKVHFALVYELRVSGVLLEVAEKGKHVAQWADITKLRAYYDRMENWSKIVLDHVIRAA